MARLKPFLYTTQPLIHRTLQIAQELGKYWKALTDQERQVYERRAADDKTRYDEVGLLRKNFSRSNQNRINVQEMRQFKLTNGPVGSATLLQVMHQV
jgi:hypothetical protein